MVREQVEPLLLERLEGGQIKRHDQPAPQVAQLTLRALDSHPHLLDVGSCLLKGLHCLSHDVGDPLVDGKDVKIGAVGDLPAGDRATGGGEEVHLLGQTKGITRIVARQRCQPQRGVFDGSGEGALKDKWRIATKGVGPTDRGYAPKGRFVAIDPTPGGRNTNGAASVGYASR